MLLVGQRVLFEVCCFVDWEGEMRGTQTVVVGAGAAGSVIASRVTEDPGRSVLLLEAGPDYPDPALLPADLVDGRQNSMVAHDWGFKHRPNRQQVLFRMPRGRVVGGSSAVNTCIALRGQPYDYDEWAALGLPEWSWEHCLPAFKKLEHDYDFDDEWHGQDGPLPIRRYPLEEQSIWQRAFVDAARSLGFPDCPDSNRPGTYGVGPHALNKRNGRRVSAAEAWLTPYVRSRENLAIQAETTVRRVLFANRAVTGVEVERHGQVEVIPTDQVILCAGAICTPGILLRSGVGPVDDVARLGVELIADVPGVGSRLLDHPGAGLFFLPRLFSGTNRLDPLIQNVLRFGSNGTSYDNDMFLQAGSNGPLPQFNLPLVSIMVNVGKTSALGSIKFLSADPHAKPEVYSRVMQHPEDRRRALDALALAYELFQTKPMKKLARPFWPTPWILKKRERMEDWLWGACDSGYHPSGTVPMGPESDPLAATDGRGRVRGVKGLRVADASLMPTIPSSNIHLPTLMIGERFGEWLKTELD